MHRSSRTTEDGNEAHAKKLERKELELARRASFFDEVARQIREREIATAASSSVSATGERRTTNGAEIDVVTTEGDQVMTLCVLSNRTHPHVDSLSVLCASGLLHLPPCTYDFLCIRDNGMLFFLGWGEWNVSVRVNPK